MKTNLLLIILATALSATAAENNQKIEVQAEMGGRGLRPGNTLPAFEYAISQGADAIEMDLQVTKDNIIVISHDPILHPPFCIGPKPDAVIHDLTLAELRKYDCGSIQYPGMTRQEKIPGTPMPTLDEVFALSSRGNFLYNIETKIAPKRRTADDARAILHSLYSAPMTPAEEAAHVRALTLQQPEMTPGPEEFDALILTLVRKYHLESRVILESFDFRTLHAMKKMEPRIKLAALCFGKEIDFVKIGEESGAGIISPIHTAVTREQVAAAHARGWTVLPWVADEPKDWDRLIGDGVDSILTSYPADLIAYLNKNQASGSKQ